MKEKSKKEIEEVQEDWKSSAPEADLDNEILVNKDKLDVLTNAKYHNKTIKQKQISTKKSKILMVVFGSIGVLGLAAGGAGLAIGLSKKAPAPIDFCEISFDPTNHGTIEGSAEIVKTKIPSNTKWKDIVRPTPVGIIDESKDIQYHFEKWTKEDGSDINPDEIITHEFKAVAFYSATTLSKYHIHTLEFSAGDKGILQDWDSLTIPYKSDEVYNVKFSTFKYLYNLPHVVPNQDYKFKCWVDQNENEMKDDTPVPEGVMNIKASYEYVEPTQQATITYTPTGDRTNKISFTQTQAIINYGSTFSIDMTLEKELVSGQKITGYVSSFSGTTGGSALAVQSVTTSGKTAKVTFKYGVVPFTDKGVDKFTVKFTGSTNDKEEWTSSVEGIKVTYSNS